ncbi:hypothetical protein A3197_17520 [Candidatus Thiodiazotropha endoloripes]|nr:hypothetical protein A3197_17520 [Candidatus Thiodiazotropha endoloripes]
MMDITLKETIATYDAIAHEYKGIRQGASCVDEIERLCNISPGKLILDVGCGPGRDVQEFLNRRYRAYGIDLSMGFLAIAKRDVGENVFTRMNLLSSAFEDDTFDSIWCCAVLSHLKKAELPMALREFKRIVKKEGKIFIAVKKGHGEGMQTEAEFTARPRRYMSYFDDEEVLGAVASAGLRTLDQYYYNELERHGGDHRDVDYIFNFSAKST